MPPKTKQGISPWPISPAMDFFYPTATTLFKFFKISVIYCSAIFPPDLALILLEYTKIIFKN